MAGKVTIGRRVGRCGRSLKNQGCHIEHERRSIVRAVRSHRKQGSSGLILKVPSLRCTPYVVQTSASKMREPKHPNHLLGRFLEPEKGHVVVNRKTMPVQEHLAQVHHRRGMMLLRPLHVMLEGNAGQRRGVGLGIYINRKRPSKKVCHKDPD